MRAKGMQLESRLQQPDGWNSAMNPHKGIVDALLIQAHASSKSELQVGRPVPKHFDVSSSSLKFWPSCDSAGLAFCGSVPSLPRDVINCSTKEDVQKLKGLPTKGNPVWQMCYPPKLLISSCERRVDDIAVLRASSTITNISAAVTTTSRYSLSSTYSAGSSLSSRDSFFAGFPSEPSSGSWLSKSTLDGPLSEDVAGKCFLLYDMTHSLVKRILRGRSANTLIARMQSFLVALKQYRLKGGLEGNGNSNAEGKCIRNAKCDHPYAYATPVSQRRGPQNNAGRARKLKETFYKRKFDLIEKEDNNGEDFRKKGHYCCEGKALSEQPLEKLGKASELLKSTDFSEEERKVSDTTQRAVSEPDPICGTGCRRDAVSSTLPMPVSVPASTFPPAASSSTSASSLSSPSVPSSTSASASHLTFPDVLSSASCLPSPPVPLPPSASESPLPSPPLLSSASAVVPLPFLPVLSSASAPSAVPSSASASLPFSSTVSPLSESPFLSPSVSSSASFFPSSSLPSSVSVSCPSATSVGSSACPVDVSLSSSLSSLSASSLSPVSCSASLFLVPSCATASHSLLAPLAAAPSMSLPQPALPHYASCSPLLFSVEHECPPLSTIASLKESSASPASLGAVACASVLSSNPSLLCSAVSESSAFGFSNVDGVCVASAVAVANSRAPAPLIRCSAGSSIPLVSMCSYVSQRSLESLTSSVSRPLTSAASISATVARNGTSANPSNTEEGKLMSAQRWQESEPSNVLPNKVLQEAMRSDCVLFPVTCAYDSASEIASGSGAAFKEPFSSSVIENDGQQMPMTGDGPVENESNCREEGELSNDDYSAWQENGTAANTETKAPLKKNRRKMKRKKVKKTLEKPGCVNKNGWKNAQQKKRRSTSGVLCGKTSGLKTEETSNSKNVDRPWSNTSLDDIMNLRPISSPFSSGGVSATAKEGHNRRSVLCKKKRNEKWKQMRARYFDCKESGLGNKHLMGNQKVAELEENTTASSRFTRKSPKLCRYFMQCGTCKNGESCPFSHCCVPETKNNSLCQFFEYGKCVKGDSCPFSHNLSSFPCRFAVCMNGYCANKSCPYSHDVAVGNLSESVKLNFVHNNKVYLKKLFQKYNRQYISTARLERKEEGSGTEMVPNDVNQRVSGQALSAPELPWYLKLYYDCIEKPKEGKKHVEQAVQVRDKDYEPQIDAEERNAECDLPAAEEALTLPYNTLRLSELTSFEEDLCFSIPVELTTKLLL